MMKNNPKISFEDALDDALIRLQKGEAVKDIIERNPSSAEELKETLLLADRLFASVRDISPAKEGLNTALESYLETPDLIEKRNVASFSSIKFNWRIALPVVGFAALAFVVLGSQTFMKSAKNTEIGKELQSEEYAVNNAENAGPTATLQEPIPTPTGNADEAVAALLSDMNQEFATLESQADAEVLAAQNESNELNTFTYAENEI